MEAPAPASASEWHHHHKAWAQAPGPAAQEEEHNWQTEADMLFIVSADQVRGIGLFVSHVGIRITEMIFRPAYCVPKS